MVNSRTMRACQVCGKPFYGTQDHNYCPECARQKKLDTIVRMRVCQDCGKEFPGGPRARRCPDCSYRAQREADRLHKKMGTKRRIGSIDRCEICGAEYTVTSGRQKYCSDACQREAVLKWQRDHKKGYSRKSGQDVSKKERRTEAKKICVYCLREFVSDKPTNLCSDYCRSEQRKLNQCAADIKRGYNRDIEKYEKKRDEYREKCRTE